jgi:hypothetical protein
VAFLRRNKPKDRRRTARAARPGLTAVYWTGGVSQPLRVRDISQGGAYIETEAEWCAGTLIHLVLDYGGSGQSPPKAAIGLWARVVRVDAHGMGMQFAQMDRAEEQRFRQFLETSIGSLGVKEQGYQAGAPGT